MRKFSVFLAVLTFASTFTRASDDTVNPFTGKSMVMSPEEIKQIENEVKQAEQRIKFTPQQVKGKNRLNLMIDDQSVLEMPGTSGDAAIEGVGPNRVLVARIDGKEVARVPFPNLKVKAADLPPLMLKDIKAAGVRCDAQKINGVPTTTVWVEGKIIYQGPGSSSAAKSHNVNGRKSVEVIVDGKVVYRAGERG